MRMILKIFVLPLMLIVAILTLLGNLLTNISSYVIGLLLLVLAGCGIFCVVNGKWTELVILISMAIASFLVLYLVVTLSDKVKALNERLGEFLRT